MSRELHFELFVGRLVRDALGEPVGRLEDARGLRYGDELLVADYLVGKAALLERFSLRGISRAALKIFGFGRSSGYVIAWDQIDLAHPDGPRCRCRCQELIPFDRVPPPARLKPAARSS